ncbi:HAMP domain-containing sensor histidine kinase [Mucilaginibacter sp. 44-25]|uniref:sensor histidine kinase n=1 Tax=Mucilaginibacter sp. 44-25 TaxID=1895794 RepID=UPI0009684B96|nr:HAMP domain-containing sensor histidine kinase [Mucilaginibacter sp. 44-25]OJW13195.1 MAG: hypothetical protein BGO48_00050 [Mucilaginibacter sp. 44-25]
MHPTKKIIAYVLILVTLLVTISLQIFWLRNVYRGEKQRLDDRLEYMIANAASRNMYDFAGINKNDSSSFRMFLKSAPWLKLRQGFDEAQSENMFRVFSEEHYKDSSYIALKFIFYTKPRPRSKVPGSQGQIFSMEERQHMDSLALNQMRIKIEKGMHDLKVNQPYHLRLFDYTWRSNKNAPEFRTLAPAFLSRLYSYDLELFHKFQLVIPSLTRTVIYEMRYQIASSMLMIGLTFVAFFLIYRLFNAQQLYADVRESFISNVTHELKTPVSTVMLAINSIRKFQLNQNPQLLEEYLNISEQELGRLTLLIDRVLNTQGMEKSADQLNLQLFDIQVLILEVIERMKILIAQNGGTCNFRQDSEPCFVLGDQFELGNVFYNLIENALKYGQKGVLIELSCYHKGKSVIISVQDNGPGIDPEYQQKVFERFFRAPLQGEVRQVKGSGLGLNYVRQVITEHYGHISLKSQLHKGCTFIINLPVHNES